MNFYKLYKEQPIENELFKHNSLFLDFDIEKQAKAISYKEPKPTKGIVLTDNKLSINSKKISKQKLAKKELLHQKDKFLFYNYHKISFANKLVFKSFEGNFKLKYLPSSLDFSKLFIKAKNSKLNLVVELKNGVQARGINSLGLFLEAKNSNITLTVLSNSTQKIRLFNFTNYLLKSNLSFVFITADWFARHRVVIVANKSNANIKHIAWLKSKTKQDVYFELIHKTTSAINARSKCVIGSAELILKGLAKITKRAENSDSFLGLHVLNLSKKARVQALPMMEIMNKNVKASHSASITEISKEKLFYLSSRGLSLKKSKALLAEAFLSFGPGGI